MFIDKLNSIIDPWESILIILGTPALKDTKINKFKPLLRFLIKNVQI